MDARESMMNAVRWMPRIACIIFILFISMFALDVFDQQAGFWRTAAGFLIHLLPSFVMTAVLALSWKRPLIGSVFFLISAFSYIFLSHGRIYLIIAVPLLVISALFLIGWSMERSSGR
jgi:hypothetical protein